MVQLGISYLLDPDHNIDTMETVDVRKKIKDLNIDLPPAETFWKIGDLTALRQDSTGNFYRSNYERGLLLYSLVVSHRPSTILEFGTGRGYGALCMAQAMCEAGIDGKIYSIDIRRYDEKQPWAIDYGNGPRMEMLSLADVWTQHCPSEWADRIVRLNGLSVDVMKRWKSRGLPSPEFAFIDGSHDYDSVKHDFFSMLHVASSSFRVVFDDYAHKQGFGVCQFIDSEIEEIFQTELVLTDRRWNEKDNLQTEDPDHGMVFLDSDRALESWRNIFPDTLVDNYLKTHRRNLWFQKWSEKAKTLARPVAKALRLR